MSGARGREHASRAAAEPRPAATVVVMRPGSDGPEVLLTKRPSTMMFGPGLHVFPGGALDPADGDPRLLARLRTAGPVPPSHAGPFMVAAIRELYEEAGVLLATPHAAVHDGGPFVDAIVAADLELRGDWLLPLSRWVTPPTAPRRFDARFFVAQLPDDALPAFDPREVVDHAWMTPRDALAAMADGRISLWPPTSTTLQQLAPAGGIADVRHHLAPSPGADAMPVVGGDATAPAFRVDRPMPSVTRVRVPGAGAIAGQTVSAYLVGKRRLVVVDPGDPSDAAIDLMLRLTTQQGGRIEAVLLTAPVPDHAAGIESLALRLRVPILAGAGAARLLSSAVESVADGARLDVADVPILARATPGTHPDHLAFELPTLDVVLVGDLEGPRASKSIPEPVDEPRLARSRAAVRELGRALHLAAHD